MKHVYICEKCGKQFNDYDEAYACEEGHLREFDNTMEPEMKTRMVFAPGEHAPKQIVLTERESKWDEEKQEYVEQFTFYTYKYVNTLADSAAATILDEYRQRREKEERDLAEWRARWQREEAERKAKQEAEAEQETA